MTGLISGLGCLTNSVCLHLCSEEKSTLIFLSEIKPTWVVYKNFIFLTSTCSWHFNDRIFLRTKNNKIWEKQFPESAKSFSFASWYSKLEKKKKFIQFQSFLLRTFSQFRNLIGTSWTLQIHKFVKILGCRGGREVYAATPWHRKSAV